MDPLVKQNGWLHASLVGLRSRCELSPTYGCGHRPPDSTSQNHRPDIHPPTNSAGQIISVGWAQRSASPPIPRTANPSPSGFTLMEIMIAMMLMAVLMLATWSLLGIYRDQFERNQQRAERSQIIRSLRQRLEADVRSCLMGSSDQPPPQQAPTLDNSATEDMEPSGPSRTSAPSESLFGGNAAEPFLGGPFPGDPTSAIGPDLAAEITDELWLQPAIGLRGNARGLVLDRLVPMEHPLSPIESDTGDLQTPVPDVVRRVIYVFTDEATSLRQGRPAGLLRCEWTEQELLVLQSAAGGGDLFSLLEMLMPDWPIVEATEALSDWTEPAAAERNQDPGRTSSTELEQLTAEITQRVDLVPEMTAFRLRFYGDGGWQDRWDSRQQNVASGRDRIAVRRPTTRGKGRRVNGNRSADRTTRRRNGRGIAGRSPPTSELTESIDPRPDVGPIANAVQQEQDQRVVLFLHRPRILIADESGLSASSRPRNSRARHDPPEPSTIGDVSRRSEMSPRDRSLAADRRLARRGVVLFVVTIVIALVACPPMLSPF